MTSHGGEHREDPAGVEMPRPTIAPLVCALGLMLLAMGVATSLAFLPVGLVLFITGLAQWIGQLLPGRGWELEPRAATELRPRPVVAAAGTVERLKLGMPGYRLRLPEKVHPLSAGINGGLVGGLVMPIPAAIYGLVSGHGIWWPVNLLAGLVLPGVNELTHAELAQFRPMLLVVGLAIHIIVSLIVGLIYGVLMPTLPEVPKPLAWGALLMPLLWTSASYLGLTAMNPQVRASIDWPWFVASQLVYGFVAAVVFMAHQRRGAVRAGLLAGFAGGLTMPIPAILWGWVTGRGAWYPLNLFASAIMERGVVSDAELQKFHGDWLAGGLAVHALLSLAFGLAFALVLPRVPVIRAPLAWGGLVLPLIWTALSYGLMRIVNPLLEQRVDWPWFVASQFVFGIAAAIVVVRSVEVHIPPAGPGITPVLPIRPAGEEGGP